MSGCDANAKSGLSVLQIVSGSDATKFEAEELYDCKRLIARLYYPSESFAGDSQLRPPLYLDYLVPIETLPFEQIVATRATYSLFFTSNWRGGITVVQYDRSGQFRITGFDKEGLRFKHLLGDLFDRASCRDLPWIELGNIKAICDRLGHPNYREALDAVVFYGKRYLHASRNSFVPLTQANHKSACVQPREQSVAPTERPWLDVLRDAPESLLERKQMFAFILSLYHHHGAQIFEELGFPSSDVSERLFHNQAGELSSLQRAAVLTALESTWQTFELERQHGSLHLWLYFAAIPIRFWTAESLNRVTADDFLSHTCELTSVWNEAENRIEAIALHVVATAAHLRYFSSHGREEFNRLVEGKSRYLGYADLEVLAFFMPHLAAYCSKTLCGLSSGRAFSADSQKMFALYAFATAFDPAIAMDALPVREQFLARCRQTLGPEKWRELISTVLAQTWVGVEQPWLANNVFLERFGSPLARLLDSDTPVRRWQMPSDEESCDEADPLFWYLIPRTAKARQSEFHVMTSTGIVECLSDAQRETAYYNELRRELEQG